MSVMPTFEEVMLNSLGCGYVTPRAVGGVSMIDAKEMFVKAYVSSAYGNRVTSFSHLLEGEDLLIALVLIYLGDTFHL